MSEKAVPQPEPTQDDVNTTPPHPQMADGKSGWTMPTPVFRKTSGYLPQGFEKRFSQDELKAQDDNDSTAEMPAPELSGDIEPQPEVVEGPDQAYMAEQSYAGVAAAPAKRSAAKIVLIVLGLLVAAALLVVLIAVVYLFYLMPTPDATF